MIWYMDPVSDRLRHQPGRDRVARSWGDIPGGEALEGFGSVGQGCLLEGTSLL
jgi:hypothetical protein